MTTSTEAPVMELKASDRCDRCGAQAFVATGHDGSVLLWCAHHFHENEAALAVFVLVDNTDTLNPSPSV